MHRLADTTRFDMSLTNYKKTKDKNNNTLSIGILLTTCHCVGIILKKSSLISVGMLLFDSFRKCLEVNCLILYEKLFLLFIFLYLSILFRVREHETWRAFVPPSEAMEPAAEGQPDRLLSEILLDLGEVPQIHRNGLTVIQ